MSLTGDQSRELAKFPQVLQDLVHAELAAGNSIVEIGAGFPAPPVGACLKLAKRVSTRPRESDDTIDFYERNSSSYSGEFTDAKRFFWVLEPPNEDAGAYPDMDAIRAEMEARQAAADAELIAAAEREVRTLKEVSRDFFDGLASSSAPTRPIKDASPLVRQYLDSMVMNYNRWHDGVGYDLEALGSMTADEREGIEQLLITKSLDDWRDVEALAALNTVSARRRLLAAFERADLSQKVDLISHATSLFTDEERAGVLVTALRNGGKDASLTQVMMEVEELHPPAVIEALWHGVREHEDVVAGQFAMMLLFLHGKASSPYDWDWRPFMLRFQGEPREPLERELRGHVGG